MPYPEQINLPFNFAAIREWFTFRHPTASQTAEQETGYSIILRGADVIVEQSGDQLTPISGELPKALQPPSPPLTFGSWKGLPVQVFQLPSTAIIPSPYLAEPFNTAADRLPDDLLTLAGLAKQILHWERQSRHCSRCGETTTPIPGTFGKKCSACDSEHFPHLHPCAIILVQRGDQLLLTRKKEWAAGRYGLVAGFLDFGESLEECAIREVKEETEIDICNVRYQGSQNWPFPAQLMAGFVADYAGGEIVVDPHELEDARWFSRHELPDLPGKRSIARWIIDTAL